jgi:hypothetical protein
MEAVKLRLHETSRETSQVGLLPAPRYLPRVNVYLAEITTCFLPDCILFSRQVDVYTWQVSLEQAIWPPDLSLLASCKRSLKAALHDVSTECASYLLAIFQRQAAMKCRLHMEKCFTQVQSPISCWTETMDTDRENEWLKMCLNCCLLRY